MRWLINYKFSEVYQMRDPRILRRWSMYNSIASLFFGVLLGLLIGVALVRYGVIPA